MPLHPCGPNAPMTAQTCVRVQIALSRRDGIDRCFEERAQTDDRAVIAEGLLWPVLIACCRDAQLLDQTDHARRAFEVKVEAAFEHHGDVAKKLNLIAETLLAVDEDASL